MKLIHQVLIFSDKKSLKTVLKYQYKFDDENEFEEVNCEIQNSEIKKLISIGLTKDMIVFKFLDQIKNEVFARRQFNVDFTVGEKMKILKDFHDNISWMLD